MDIFVLFFFLKEIVFHYLELLFKVFVIIIQVVI